MANVADFLADNWLKWLLLMIAINCLLIYLKGVPRTIEGAHEHSELVLKDDKTKALVFLGFAATMLFLVSVLINVFRAFSAL